MSFQFPRYRWSVQHLLIIGAILLPAAQSAFAVTVTYTSDDRVLVYTDSDGYRAVTSPSVPYGDFFGSTLSANGFSVDIGETWLGLRGYGGSLSNTSSEFDIAFVVDEPTWMSLSGEIRGYNDRYMENEPGANPGGSLDMGLVMLDPQNGDESLYEVNFRRGDISVFSSPVHSGVNFLYGYTPLSFNRILQPGEYRFYQTTRVGGQGMVNYDFEVQFLEAPTPPAAYLFVSAVAGLGSIRGLRRQKKGALKKGL